MVKAEHVSVKHAIVHLPLLRNSRMNYENKLLALIKINTINVPITVKCLTVFHNTNTCKPYLMTHLSGNWEHFKR